MRRTLIKICGVTRPEDAAALAALDIDIIGLNFVAGGARRIDAGQALALTDAIAGRCQVWGVFVDPSPQVVEQLLSEVRLDVLQWHGDEHPAFCRQFGVPYVKVIAMQSGTDLRVLADRYHDANMLLLDTYVAGRSGGTGQTFDWARWPASCALPLMLAGGLDAGNVGLAVQQLRPAGVDVSSGVEGEQKGVKDLAKCRQFVAAVRAADAKEHSCE